MYWIHWLNKNKKERRKERKLCIHLSNMHERGKERRKIHSYAKMSCTSSFSLHLNTLAPKIEKNQFLFSIFISYFKRKDFNFYIYFILSDMLCLFRDVEKNYEWFLCDFFLNTTLDFRIYTIYIHTWRMKWVIEKSKKLHCGTRNNYIETNFFVLNSPWTRKSAQTSDSFRLKQKVKKCRLQLIYEYWNCWYRRFFWLHCMANEKCAPQCIRNQ